MRYLMLLTSVTFAAGFICGGICRPADAQVTCQQIGTQMFCSNGLSSNTVGNSTFYSNGVTQQRLGNMDFYTLPPAPPPPLPVYRPPNPWR